LAPAQNVPLERSNVLAVRAVPNPQCVILEYHVVAIFTNGIAESLEVKPWTLGSSSDPRAYVNCFARVYEARAVDRCGHRSRRQVTDTHKQNEHVIRTIHRDLRFTISTDGLRCGDLRRNTNQRPARGGSMQSKPLLRWKNSGRFYQEGAWPEQAHT
jgi:hypothetical protein